MPSPIGHALGGLAAGCLIARCPRLGSLVLFATVGMLPDLDLLLPVQHRGPAHSVGAAALACGLALFVDTLRTPASINVRFAAAVAAAYLSHIFLDWLGADRWSPRGIMALWPFSSEFYVSGLDLFSRIERRYWLPDFWWGNAISVLREIAILGPVTWGAWTVARRRRSRDHPAR